MASEPKPQAEKTPTSKKAAKAPQEIDLDDVEADLALLFAENDEEAAVELPASNDAASKGAPSSGKPVPESDAFVDIGDDIIDIGDEVIGDEVIGDWDLPVSEGVAQDKKQKPPAVADKKTWSPETVHDDRYVDNALDALEIEADSDTLDVIDDDLGGLHG